jgi:SAM-dependent methyltransferase
VVVCNHVLYHLPDRDRGIAELARALKPGGRFVGVYNFRDHLDEVWSAVGDPWSEQPDFDCETGGDELARHFSRVECRPTEGSVVWLTRDDLQRYLDAYSEMLGPLTAPEGPFPFTARRHNCVLIADK